MNSESARKSSQEMKKVQKEMLERAQQAQPAVVLTDANWKALIASQQNQIKTLGQLLDIAYTHADREELVGWANQMMGILRADALEQRREQGQYKEELTAVLNKQTALLESTVTDTEKQVGSMREKFSSAILQEQTQLRKAQKKLFWISLIPSLTLVILEWTLRIWPLIFPG